MGIMAFASLASNILKSRLGLRLRGPLFMLGVSLASAVMQAYERKAILSVMHRTDGSFSFIQLACNYGLFFPGSWLRNQLEFVSRRRAS